jgi:ATP/maltotriose-dependent transcriptional regulator MalT
VLRGRELELARLAEVLDTTISSGCGTVVSVVGPAGIGKTVLLAEVENAAIARGFQVAHIELDEDLRPDALASLLHGTGLVEQTSGQRPGDDLRDLLKNRLTRAPLLIVLDDLLWGEPATSQALGVLSSQVVTHPLVCVLARRPAENEPRLDRLLRYLKDRASTVHLQLGSLPDEAVTAVVEDMLGAAPDEDLKALVDCAEGNPAVLIELVQGVAHEGGVRHDGGAARLTSTFATPVSAGLMTGFVARRLPKHFGELVYSRLESLSPRTRQMLDVAAVLGRTFVPDDVAEMLDMPVAALTPAFKEALAANALVCTAEAMSFRRDLVWQVVMQNMPASVRGALHRQAAAMLLERGDSVVKSADHLVHGALRGDVGTVEVLRRAAEETLGLSPGTAAQLALRGLELISPESEVHLPLTIIAVEACTRSGPLARAVELANDALTRPLSSTSAATLRYWLSTALLLGGRHADALDVAEKVLTAPDAPADLRQDMLLNQLFGLTVQDDPASLRRAEHALLEADRSGRETGALAISAITKWRAGNLTEALDICRKTAHAPECRLTSTWIGHPRMAVAAILTQLREFDDARAAINEVENDIDFVLSGLPRIMRAQLELAEGRSDSAVTEATVGIAIAEEAGICLYKPIALAVLATVALRRGDLAAVKHRELRQKEASPDTTGAYSAVEVWVEAQVAAALADHEGCLRALDRISRAEETRRVLFAEEPAAAAWVVRTALAAGRQDWALAAVTTADRLAAENSDAPSVVAAALHARGLLERDTAALERAVEAHRDMWARASATEDLGTLLINVDREAAVAQLDRAVTLYQSMQAERDAARGRRRLREAGVVRRHWRCLNRPATGLTSLTETERNVANLVVAGLTNRQVASLMFLSQHTVAFHLRKVFRKLDINSRFELIRYFHPDPAQPGGPFTSLLLSS